MHKNREKTLVIALITLVAVFTLIVSLNSTAREVFFGKAIDVSLPSYSEFTLTSCGTPSDGWSRNTLFKLDRDLVVTSNICFTITDANKIKLDCDGHSITGGNIGFYILGSDDVAITNCNFANNGNGVNVDGSSTNIVINSNTFNGNSIPISILSSNNNLIDSNTITGATSMAIFLRNAHENVISRNIITENFIGVNTDGANRNSFVDNVISNNGGGILLDGSSDNYFISNEISNNNGDGMKTSKVLTNINSVDNLLKDTTICGNGGNNLNCVAGNFVNSNGNTVTGADVSCGWGVGEYEECAVLAVDSDGDFVCDTADSDPLICTTGPDQCNKVDGQGNIIFEDRTDNVYQKVNSETLAGCTLGDLNKDWCVNQNDIDIVRTSIDPFCSGGAYTAEQGDLDFDGCVGQSDLDIMRGNVDPFCVPQVS